MKQMTYISLFSSAGVGCYGFKEKRVAPAEPVVAKFVLVDDKAQVERIKNIS